MYFAYDLMLGETDKGSVLDSCKVGVITNQKATRSNSPYNF
jgi:hypothetical protein